MINPLKGMVEKVLRDVPSSRENDVLLMVEVWRAFHPSRILLNRVTGDEGIRLDDIRHMPQIDAVRRIRARLNAKGKYLPAGHDPRAKRKAENPTHPDTTFTPSTQL